MGSVCDVWISQVLGSVSAMLNISGLNICVFRVEYLSLQDLCHPLVKISHLQGCVNHRENLRYLSLCQMCRISQSLKSVSHMPENSESQVCVYVMNTSILLICVKCKEYLRVSSLCLMCKISQTLSYFFCKMLNISSTLDCVGTERHVYVLFICSRHWLFFDFPRFKFNKFDVRQQGISLKYCFVPVPMA